MIEAQRAQAEAQKAQAEDEVKWAEIEAAAQKETEKMKLVAVQEGSPV